MFKSNPNIIPFSQSETKSWQREIANSFKNLGDLLDYLEIDEKKRHLFKNEPNFPLRVTHFYADLIKKNDINDPLFLQIIPQTKEAHIVEHYTSDAVGDLNALKAPGLIHKYQGRVLISLTEACAIHCRYCFRREFPYSENIPDFSLNGPILNYLKKYKDINEVILSGGDPLMLSDKKLITILKSLDSIDHVSTIRFHTRMPSLEPSRVTQDLLKTLSSSNKKIVMVLHINHPNEINTHVINACQLLKKHNVTLLNQSVILNNVNNSVHVLKALSQSLFNAGILPYYIHCLDKVNGTAHFDSPREDSLKLIQNLKESLPGYLIPKLVEEIRGEKSKTHIF